MPSKGHEAQILFCFTIRCNLRSKTLVLSSAEVCEHSSSLEIESLLKLI